MRAPHVLVAALITLTPIALFTTHRPAGAEVGTVTLGWTAPGDDSLTGTATAYDMRYFPLPITAENFLSAFQVTAEPAPLGAGRAQTFTVHGLVPGAYYYFAIRTVDDAGNWSAISNVVKVRASYALGADDTPVVLDFSAPSPNPARSLASFSLGLPGEGQVDIEAFDIAGRHVRTLWSGTHAAGRSTVLWDLRGDDGRPLGAGLYLVRARIAGRVFVRRITVAR